MTSRSAAGPMPRGPGPRLGRSRLVISGIVQGVGFRPFIHRLAHHLGLNGWVLNSTEGVVIEVEGETDLLDRFVRAIPREAPPRAKVDRIDCTSLPPIGYTSFAIEPSRETEGHFALISPDICLCDDCLREMLDPTDRRYRYPFINCTNCGPRFTLVADIPYDRPKTTMGCFPMCPECEREYHDPANRRFHAQPNACPVCGPRIWLVHRDVGADISAGPPSPPAGPSLPPVGAGVSAGPPGECPPGEGIGIATQRPPEAEAIGLKRQSPSGWDAGQGSVPSPGTSAEETVGAPLAGARSPGEEDVPLSDEARAGVEPAATAPLGEEALQETRRLLASGAIVAVKGLGGFHLACDATNDEAVASLRRRKRRSDKPFAVMSLDADTVASYCQLSDEERQLLESPQRPIVLLHRKEGSPISPLVAPNNRFLGVMLPYTPLHYLLLERSATPEQPTHHSSLITHHSPLALVMTSGNLSEEPIATGNREALERLDSLADAFLLHNRDIRIRCDDSVTRLFRGQESTIRRSRGYAPFPIRLGFDLRDILACGAELKNSFCITKGNYAFLSQHIGDLENAETLQSFADSVEHFRRLFRLEIAGVAHDLHPEYLSTRYAWDLAEGGSKLPLVPVQHHHAHIAACMAENGVEEPVIGVSFDGTGYGDDGHLWGGEFLVCDFAGYRRAAHLKYLTLPGGEAAIKRPYRMAISYLVDSFGPDILAEDLPPLREADPSELAVLRRQIERGINSPLTSSAGRLFDAVSSLVGIRQVVNYEGQAAIELEMAAREGIDGRYDWVLLPGDPRIIDVAPALRQVVGDWRRGIPAGVISASFHNTVADVIARTCDWLREETGLTRVALSGGVFQNLFLLDRACRLLEARGFRVLLHHQVPPNDGGIALGQAVIANRVMSHE